jgi:hypothetical protein
MSYGSNGLISLSYRFASGGALVGTAGSTYSVGALRLAVDGGPEEVMSEFNDAWRSNIPAGDYAQTLSRPGDRSDLWTKCDSAAGCVSLAAGGGFWDGALHRRTEPHVAQIKFRLLQRQEPQVSPMSVPPAIRT